MSGVGRLAVSAVSATNENDLALANFDVDFALIKVEAPKEYHGLGAVLSHRRLENAEQGPLHRTARRLGALFEHLVPPIQILVEAYGKRVSEISASGKLNRKVSQWCLSSNDAHSSEPSGFFFTLDSTLVDREHYKDKS